MGPVLEYNKLNYSEHLATVNIQLGTEYWMNVEIIPYKTKLLYWRLNTLHVYA